MITQRKQKDYNLNLRKETEHFIIHYSEFDKECIDKVLEVLENSYNKITDNLKEELQEKLIIELHPDHNELHIALGFPDAPDWVRGGLGIGKIVIASPLNPPPGSDFNNVVNTAVHEFVHIIVNKINDNTPRWLNEGIACYEAKDNNENWIIKTVKNGLMNNTLPTFKDLDTGEDFETFFKLNGYQYSYTIVESIIKLFGYEKLRNLIKSPNSYIEIFGMNEKELQDKWIDYIKANYCMKDFFLRSARIGFSIWSDNDVSDALELWGSPAVTKFITADGKMSKEQVEQRLKKEIESYREHNIQYFPIYLIGTNENFGCCGLRPYDLESNIVEMGIHLKEEYWGKGIAKEACVAVIDYAFKILKVNGIFAGHNPNNKTSAGVLKKLGFTYTHDEYYPPTRLYHPSYLMKREDWK